MTANLSDTGYVAISSEETPNDSDLSISGDKNILNLLACSDTESDLHPSDRAKSTVQGTYGLCPANNTAHQKWTPEKHYISE